MKLRMLVTILTAAGLTGTVACSDDENTTTGPGNIGESNRATVEGVMFGVVMPLIRQIALEGYISQVSPAAGTPSTDACEPLDICTGGTAELCSDPGTFQVNFTQCQLGGTEIDGSVSINYSGPSGAGTYSVSMVTASGNISMTGNVSYEQDSQCFGQTFTNGTVIAGNLTMGLAGGIGWCEPRSMVGGTVVPSYASFEVTIPSLDQLVDITVFSDPPGDVEIVLLNLNRTVSLHVCHGNITQSSFTDCADI